MKSTTKKLPKSQVEIMIEQPTEDVAKYRKKVIDTASKNANIKGFRKGASIPEDVIVRQFGEDVINQMTIEKAIEENYRDTLKQEQLIPVGQAEIQEVLSQDPLKVKLVVEVFPEVTVDEKYKNITLKKQKVDVSDDEIQAALDDIQTRFTHFHDTPEDYQAQMGDRVTIDTDGFDETGNILASTSMRDYPLVLGTNLLVSGFEEDIVGMKQGEQKEIDVVFPEEYHNSEFAGKKTKFSVTVKKIEAAHKPEFTPEFIEQLRGKKLDIKGFKKLIEEEILETKQSNAQIQQEIELIEELLKHTQLEIGDQLLSQQIEQVYGEIKENVAKDGVRMEDYLASLGTSEEAYKQQHVREPALKRLQGELILNELAKKEDVVVDDTQMQEEVQKVMSRFQSEDVLERLKELYVPGNKYYEELRRRVAYRQLIDSFFE